MPAISVIHSHRDFYIVTKPAGENFHSEGYSEGQSGFFEQVNSNFPGETLYPVHRLDKMTSGLMIVARSLEASKKFGDMFEQKRVSKYYLAISASKPIKKQGWVKGDMVKARNGNWRLSRGNRNPAITYFFSRSIGEGLRAFVLKPHTGKTHQLRVALKSVGAPVLGDPRYAPAEQVKQSDRGYLHAYALTFEWRGEQCEFRAVPDSGKFFLKGDMQRLLTSEWLHPKDLNWPSPA